MIYFHLCKLRVEIYFLKLFFDVIGDFNFCRYSVYISFD